MPKIKASASVTADAQISLENTVYYGYTVTVVTATAAINIRRTSDAGQIIDVIPSGTAAGATKHLSNGIHTDALFVDFNGASGTVVIHYE